MLLVKPRPTLQRICSERKNILYCKCGLLSSTLFQHRSPALQTPNRGLPTNSPFFSFQYHARWLGKHRRLHFFPNSPCHASPRNAPTSSVDHQPCRPQTEGSPPTVHPLAFTITLVGRASIVGCSSSQTRHVMPAQEMHPLPAPITSLADPKQPV
jgi:hypothetical protein